MCAGRTQEGENRAAVSTPWSGRPEHICCHGETFLQQTFRGRNKMDPLPEVASQMRVRRSCYWLGSGAGLWRCCGNGAAGKTKGGCTKNRAAVRNLRRCLMPTFRTTKIFVLAIVQVSLPAKIFLLLFPFQKVRPAEQDLWSRVSMPPQGFVY